MQPTGPSKQRIRARYLGHVTGYYPISDQYFLIRSVPAGNITALQHWFVFRNNYPGVSYYMCPIIYFLESYFHPVLVSSYAFLGYIFGCVFWGWLGDKIGRLPCLHICQGINTLILFATSRSPNFLCYALARTAAGTWRLTNCSAHTWSHVNFQNENSFISSF